MDINQPARFVGIDPSTKTGFVALSANEEVLTAKELTGVRSEDPLRMITLIDEVIRHVQKDDFIVIENFGFATQQGIMLGGIGWGIRMALVRRGMKYIEVAPGQLKKFGNGKGNASKDELAVGIYKNFGFEHSNDNVRDAYVLAQIGRALVTKKVSYQYQKEVIETILNPPKTKKKGRK